MTLDLSPREIDLLLDCLEYVRAVDEEDVSAAVRELIAKLRDVLGVSE